MTSSAAAASCAGAKAFIAQYGPDCWELDAMNPRVLRARVERAIKQLINGDAWRAALDREAEELQWLAAARVRS